MKIRSSFVSNSSSSSFLIKNKTDKPLLLDKLIEEVPWMFQAFMENYDWYKKDPGFTEEKFRESVKERKFLLFPGETKCYFGNEDGDLAGHVLGVMLRENNGEGESESFSWYFLEYHG